MSTTTKPTELPEQDPLIFEFYLDYLYDDAMPEIHLLAPLPVTPGVTDINIIREK